MSLVDSIGGAQLAIQAAIRSNASPEIANMFMRKENAALRSRLAALESDRRLIKISEEAFVSQTIEILLMLVKLKEPLNLSEQETLRRVSCLLLYCFLFYLMVLLIEQHSKNMDGFTAAGSLDIGSIFRFVVVITIKLTFFYAIDSSVTISNASKDINVVNK